MADILLMNFNPDWKLMRKQKADLIKLSSNSGDAELANRIDGLIRLLNDIQDQAAESGIWEETEIFGKRKPRLF
jgi:hypothetical protein